MKTIRIIIKDGMVYIKGKSDPKVKIVVRDYDSGSTNGEDEIGNEMMMYEPDYI